MGLRVYALVPASVRVAKSWRGTRGEPLRSVRCGPLALLVAEAEDVPHPDRANLERQDALMRQIAVEVPAILPARFGLMVDDVDELRALVDAKRDSLREALRLVTGREQMTLRVLTPHAEKPVVARPDGSATQGPGHLYLIQRAAGLRPPEDRRLADLLQRLSRLICRERISRGQMPGVSIFYHLIQRGQSAAYRGVIRQFLTEQPDPTVTASGPFPPYAFAPDLGASFEARSRKRPC